MIKQGSKLCVRLSALSRCTFSIRANCSVVNYNVESAFFGGDLWIFRFKVNANVRATFNSTIKPCRSMVHNLIPVPSCVANAVGRVFQLHFHFIDYVLCNWWNTIRFDVVQLLLPPILKVQKWHLQKEVAVHLSFVKYV